ISDVSLSVPAIVGRNGIEELVPISLSEEERTKLSESAAVLKKTMEGVEF
ncbi:MAG: L-lactate dehydrogenase, partial [Solobacterium sp.]|nr:L-lactate dehydrogenase [Solobacterium sp.]